MKSKNVAVLITLVVAVGALSVAGWMYYQKNRFYYAPRNESNLFALGQIEASKGKHAEAVKVYQEMLQKDPKHTVAMKFMIDSMIKLDDRSMVFPSLDKLISLEPTKENLEYAASISLQMNDREKADNYKKQIENLEKKH